ncbi:putative lipoyltransferase 2, mitochondrial [Gigantopelta aegis]|uniref:putative lipoyltransferase 2, mitochondrial n=1 Tax=Gigantopelta aegis TaxID=1735272 RepID=UPI001B88BD84|nr:putative lipoyltransferase 2, mitochondrial [Gigantopelta aegis]
MALSVSKRLVYVINLGRMGFLAANDVQMRYARQHLDALAGHPSTRPKNVILMVEHNPVYTVGIRNSEYGYETENKLKSLGAEFYQTNRGGLITFHGPGQLVAYPILNLQHFKPSMKWYISSLEKTLVRSCKYFGVSAQTSTHTGVWVKDRKIAAIGVHGKRYVTTHGISLNCNTDLSWFQHIEACGIPEKEVTSLSKEMDRPITIDEVIGPFLEAFEKTFDCHIDSSMLESGNFSSVFSRSVNGPKMYSDIRQMSTATRK